MVVWIAARRLAATQVLALLADGHTNLAPDPRMGAAVEALVRSSAVTDPGPATFRLGQGVWEVLPCSASPRQGFSCSSLCLLVSTAHAGSSGSGMRVVVEALPRKPASTWHRQVLKTLKDD